MFYRKNRKRISKVFFIKKPLRNTIKYIDPKRLKKNDIRSVKK